MSPRFGEESQISIVRTLVRLGIVQNEKQGQYILATVGVICILFTAWMMVPEKRPPQDDVQQNPNYEPSR